MVKIEICEEFKKQLEEISDKLENQRLKIYQEEVCFWEENKDYVSDRLFSLQLQIRNVAEIVGWMDFKKDKKDLL